MVEVSSDNSYETENTNVDLSKFWAFRLINAVSVVSIFVLLTILIIPIPYFRKERKPCIIDLDFNSGGFSHAIKFTSKKLSGNLVSVNFSTYNSDHIIGNVGFSHISLGYHESCLARFVNAHYYERRKGLPYRITLFDCYSNFFVLRRFTSNNLDSTYKEIEHSVYSFPIGDKYYKPLDTSLADLMSSKQKNIYKASYRDLDDKIVTQYYPTGPFTIGTIKVGTTPICIEKNTSYRTLTTVNLNSFKVTKLIVTTIRKGSETPSYQEFYVHDDDPDKVFKNLKDLSSHLNIAFSKEDFQITRFEGGTKSPVNYYYEGHNKDPLLTFSLTTRLYKYDIVCSDAPDSIVKFHLNTSTVFVSEDDHNAFDRVVVIHYVDKTIKPNFYVFDRMLYYNKVHPITSN